MHTHTLYTIHTQQTIQNKQKVMSFTDSMPISSMKYLDLFDDIPYKFIKSYHDDDDVEVDIKDMGGNNYNRCTTKFTFELKINVSGGCMPIWNNMEFTVVKEYDSTSPYALHIIENLWEEEDEDDICARTIQALARGVLTRRNIHFALLSSDPDALASIM